MDYVPRYSQPFTLAQAVLLDVATISEGYQDLCRESALNLQGGTEIARLNNSLEHLKRTQDTLQEYLAAPSTSDPELERAKEENEIVMCAIPLSGKWINHNLQ
jgi:hypothetical protein